MTKVILIANSDKADHEDFQKIFETKDYKLVFSENEEEVLSLAKLLKPHLIIAGPSLKGRNILELCETMKTNPIYKDILFILLFNIFQEIPVKDRERTKANGVIYKPLHKGEVLDVVGQVLEEEAGRLKSGEIHERETELKSLSDIGKESLEKKKEDFAVEFGEMEEEIIELVDTLEKPETRRDIHDTFIPGIEKTIDDIIPTRSWEKMERGREIKTEDMPPLLKKEVTPQKDVSIEELFERIELEEVLEEMEKKEPSLKKVEPQADVSIPLNERFETREESMKDFLGLESFQEALEKEVGLFEKEGELQPLSFEITETEVSTKATPNEIYMKKGISELPGGDSLQELTEEVLREDEIGFIDEGEEKMPEEVKIEKPKEVEAPVFLEERVSSLVKTVDRQMEDVVLKGVRVMVEEFVTRLVPEMTQNIVDLTLERIEKIVRDIVPDLAEKAIQEEIKKLQKE